MDADSASGAPGPAGRMLGLEDDDRDAVCDLPPASADATGCAVPLDLVAPPLAVDEPTVAPPA